jgi:hypothetical protein
MSTLVALLIWAWIGVSLLFLFEFYVLRALRKELRREYQEFAFRTYDTPFNE